MAEGSDWAFSWFKQSPNQTLEKQTLIGSIFLGQGSIFISHAVEMFDKKYLVTLLEKQGLVILDSIITTTATTLQQRSRLNNREFKVRFAGHD